MKKQGLMRIMAIVLVVLFLASAIGCSRDETKKADQNEAQTQGSNTESGETSSLETKPVPIKIMRPAVSQDPNEDRILLELQRRTNTKLEFVTASWETYVEKLSMFMVSGEDIDIAVTDFTGMAISWAKEGLLLAYDDIMDKDKYPYTQAILDADVFQGMKINGKMYYKPLPLAPMVHGHVIRTDWLEKVGLPKPTNLDELYQVLKAFKFSDPDGNGKDDTVGWFSCSDYYNWSNSYIAKAFVIGLADDNNYWVEMPDNSVTHVYVSDNYKQYIAFMRKLINDGIVNKDWTTTTYANNDKDNAFLTGKVGINLTTSPQTLIESLNSIDPNAKIEYLPPIEGIEGVPANSGYSGGYWMGNVILSRSENPQKALELMESTMTFEGRELTNFGIRGIHIKDVKQEGNMYIYTLDEEECQKDWNTEQEGYIYALANGWLNYYERTFLDFVKYKDLDDAIKNAQPMISDKQSQGMYPNWFGMNAEYSVRGPILNVSDENIVTDSKLISYADEYLFKMVLAKDDTEFERLWNEYIAEWMALGGKELIENGNAYYKNMNK